MIGLALSVPAWLLLLGAVVIDIAATGYVYWSSGRHG